MPALDIDAGTLPNWLTWYGNGCTALILANPANKKGKISQVTMKTLYTGPVINLSFGMFYHTGVPANQYKCGSAVQLGNQNFPGSQRTFSGLNLACEPGDIIGWFAGLYGDGPRIDHDYGTPGPGLYSLGANINHCVVDDEAIYSFLYGAYSACYGEGSGVAAGHPPISIGRLFPPIVNIRT